MKQIIYVCSLNLRLKIIFSMKKKVESKKMVCGCHEQKYMTPKEMFSYLSQKDKAEFRDKYLQLTGMSYPGFYNKLSRNNFKPLELQSFNDLIKTYSFPHVII